MSLSEELAQKHREWCALQPIAPVYEKVLWEKLRLEWNYHSNHIEGNTLTYGETEILLIHGQVSGDHSYRDYLEMAAHDAAITHLRKLAGDERPINEIDIRDLNRILLKEPFRKDAISPEGRATTIEIIPGQYKESPNNVRTKSGGIFEFASPEDVPVRMKRFIEALHSGLASETVSVIEFIAQIHHDFVLIHPFGDGNGRTARLLVNYILMRKGYVPLIIPTGEKDSYLAALRKADTGEGDALVGFLGVCAEVALDRGIRAAKGENIEEEDDLAKEIEIFKRRHGEESKELLPKTLSTIRKVYHESLEPLFDEFVLEHDRFADLFQSMDVAPIGIPPQQGREWKPLIENWLGGQQAASLLQLGVQIHLNGFRGKAPVPFSIDATLQVRFLDFKFEIQAEGIEEHKHLYADPLVPSVRKEIVKKVLANVFSKIKKESDNDS